LTIARHTHKRERDIREECNRYTHTHTHTRERERET
jgi:hypothetical protein